MQVRCISAVASISFVNLVHLQKVYGSAKEETVVVNRPITVVEDSHQLMA